MVVFLLLLLLFCCYCYDDELLFCSRLARVKQKLEELNKLVDTVQQSSAHMETVTHNREPNTHVQQAATAQKEIERELRWER